MGYKRFRALVTLEGVGKMYALEPKEPPEAASDRIADREIVLYKQWNKS